MHAGFKRGKSCPFKPGRRSHEGLCPHVAFRCRRFKSRRSCALCPKLKFRALTCFSLARASSGTARCRRNRDAPRNTSKEGTCRSISKYKSWCLGLSIASSRPGTARHDHMQRRWRLSGLCRNPAVKICEAFRDSSSRVKSDMRFTLSPISSETASAESQHAGATGPARREACGGHVLLDLATFCWS